MKTFGSFDKNPNTSGNVSKPNAALTSALRASLRVIDGEQLTPDETPSPLTEATPDSIDELLNRLNDSLILGNPLNDDELLKMADLYRSQALKYAQDEQNKPQRTRRGPSVNTLAEMVELEF